MIQTYESINRHEGPLLPAPVLSPLPKVRVAPVLNLSSLPDVTGRNNLRQEGCQPVDQLTEEQPMRSSHGKEELVTYKKEQSATHKASPAAHHFGQHKDEQ